MPAFLYIFFQLTDGRREFCAYEAPSGCVDFDLADGEKVLYLIVRPHDPGYWFVHQSAVEDVFCTPLPESSRFSWWHRLLGQALTDPGRGQGIRIGVVDGDFLPDFGLEHVEVATPEGWESVASAAAGAHGDYVCRIIGDRSAPASCAPIAPGAALIFSSGSFTQATAQDDDFQFLAADEEIGSTLDPTMVPSAIMSLAVDFRADVINLSLGTFHKRAVYSGVDRAIEVARKHGTVVVCAAGNDFVPAAAFPAARDDCIGVGAIGDADWGPPHSYVRFLAERTAHDRTRRGKWAGRAIFHSPESAYGAGMDMVAPGVGITVSRDGMPALDLTGTSFAAPIVAGLVAVALASNETYRDLPRTLSRTIFAEEALKALCSSGGLESRYEGLGIPALP